MVEKAVKNRAGLTLIELVITVAIIGVLVGLGMGPFTKWIRTSKLESQAANVHETVKYCQTIAQRLGDADIIDGVLARQRVYFAVNIGTGEYRIASWIDKNSNNLREDDEFEVLQSDKLVNVSFSVLGSVNKKAGTNNAGAPSSADSNFQDCPKDIAVLAGFKCTRFDSKGFMTEVMQNQVLYLADGNESFAISINPAGITNLWRWGGSSWRFVR